jgi:AcrR family transcriptional regulator
MSKSVKASPGIPRGQRQVARTEGRVLAAATRLFLQRGYTATTLTDVAQAADVGERTVYVRFGSKALLFKRVVDAAILEARIRATASANRQIVERTGALFAVAQQAAAVEPLIAEFWQHGRAGLRHGQRMVWARMADDRLLPPGCDLEWIIDTASVVVSPETYLLITRMMGWDLDTYEAWLVTTLRRLSAGQAGD